VTGGLQLLNTAGDYFQFVTKFFEVIKLSAPHIYHSALELSPQSSIVREQYYFKLFQDHRPWVICGVSSSWKPAGINGNYGSYTWSPCGQFFAAQRPTSVEIRDTLTLDKHCTLQPTKPIPKDLESIDHSPNALAYSPDGHSLASCFGSTAIIWDIQTGGVIKEIECGAVDASPKALVWSLDGTTVGAIFPAEVGSWIVVIYDTTSVNISTRIVQSPYEPYLCPHGGSIWMMALSENKTTINIFGIWPTVMVDPVKSYFVNYIFSDGSPLVMHQCGLLSGVSHNGVRCIYSIQTQGFLSTPHSFFTTISFSPHGNLLAASSIHEVHIWRLGENSQVYRQWKTFPLWEAPGDAPRGLTFSPTSSSLLISRDGYLEVQPLDGFITHTPEKIPSIKFSSNGTYLVAAFKDKSTIVIINLFNNNLQLIDTNFAICQLTLAGNILFVGGSSGCIAAWRLAAEGIVDRAPDIERVDHSSSLWIKDQMGSNVKFWANNQTGIIVGSDKTVYYDVKTGKEFKSPMPKIPLPSSSPWKDFYHDSDDTDFNTWPSFSYYDLVECNDHPSKDNLPASTPWYQEGWLMYPEGEYQHRLWLPTHWRTKWEEAHWLNEIKMLRFTTASGKVVIKL